MDLLLALLAVTGLIQAICGWLAVRSWRRVAAVPWAGPPVTILKPLHGDEPLLEEALASVCAQDYGPYQIVFGVQNATDPALAVVARLRARFPERDIEVVIDPRPHGVNHKISNLINMFPAARHDVLVIADSDVHVADDYLGQIVAALQRPGVGLVTALYVGRPGRSGFAASMGATAISHGFLPGALLARRLGRQDCLGATMALRRETLEKVGGLEALVHHIADDHVLGRLVRALGLSVQLAQTLTATTVPEATMRALFHHELRWARTIRSMVPVSFALSAVQFPLGWAMLAAVAAGFQSWALALVLGVWAGQAAVARGIDRALGVAGGGAVWMRPLRDMMSLTVVAASYVSDRVEWRGTVLRLSPVELPSYAINRALPGKATAPLGRPT